MELSDNDRQRIEQEAAKWIEANNGWTYNGFKEGAEFATRYERNWVIHLQERVRVLA